MLIVSVESTHITVIFIISYVVKNSRTFRRILAAFQRYIIRASANGSAITEAIDIGQKLSYRGAVLDSVASFLSGLRIRVEGLIINAGQLIMI